MSPEQAMGDGDVDHRTDLWSVGAILYEMLLGRVPYDGRTYNIVISKLLTEQFPAPREVAPELPAEVEEVVLGAMARELKARYDSAVEFRAAVQRAREAVAELEGRAPDAAATLASRSRAQLDSDAPTLESHSDAPTAVLERGAVDDERSDTLTTTTEATKTVSRSRPKTPLLAGVFAVALLGAIIGAGAVLLDLSPGDDEDPGSIAAGRPDARALAEPATPLPDAGEPTPRPTPELREAAEEEPPTAPAPATAAPPPPASPPSPPPGQRLPRSEPRPLDRDEIRRELTGLEAQVRRCLLRGDSPPDRLVLRVAIDGSGRARYVGATPAPPASATRCLRQLFARARLRETGAETVTVTHAYRGSGLMSSPFDE